MSQFPPLPPPNAPKKEYAQFLRSIGRETGAFKVFPIIPHAKQPAVKDWQQVASWDEKTVDCMWQNEPDSNIGLAIQEGFVVLDADIYKPGAEAELAQFERQYGKLPDTLEFDSARGGYHLIFSTERLLGNGKGHLPNFGDVRGNGGYIVGPGSIFEGKRYSVRADCLVPPLPLPHAVDSMLSVRTTAGSKEPPQGVILDDPINKDYFRRWLLGEPVRGMKGAKPSIAGQNGNDMLAYAGAMGSSFALTIETTIEMLIEHFNPRCLPPWDDTEIEKHGGSGYKTAKSDFGNKAHASALFKPVIGEPMPGEKIFYTMADIIGPAPARQWALGTDADGWLPMGDITLLYGPGGAGKTTLGGQICLSLARGEKLFGLIPCVKMPVLFIACEDSIHELHRRFEKQGRRADDDVVFASLVGKHAALHKPFRGPQQEGETWLYDALDAKLGEMPAGPKLLILDNLAHLFEGDYYAPVEVAKFLNAYCRRLIMKHDATMLLFAHPSEGQAKDGSGGYGGVGWSAGVRSRLYFDRHTKRVKEGRSTKLVRIGEERLFSRKKSNMTKEHDENGGIVLNWQDYNFVPTLSKTETVQRPEFKPVKSASEEAVLPIVLATLERVAAEKSGRWSERKLALAISHQMGLDGHALGSDQIRTKYLKEIVGQGHRFYDRVKGEWISFRETHH